MVILGKAKEQVFDGRAMGSKMGLFGNSPRLVDGCPHELFIKLLTYV